MIFILDVKRIISLVSVKYLKNREREKIDVCLSQKANGKNEPFFRLSLAIWP